MSFLNKENIVRFLKIVLFASSASFITMIAVQYFMGGITYIGEVLLKSVLIGLGLALTISVIPKRENKYPWQ